MHNISHVPVTTSHSDSTQESHGSVAPVTVNPALHRSKSTSPELQGLPMTKSRAQPQQTEAGISGETSGNQWRRAVLEKQRQEVSMSAGPSDNVHLNALNELLKRDGDPSPGGLELRSNPNSLIGGLRQANRPLHEIEFQHRAVSDEIRRLEQEVRWLKSQHNAARLAANSPEGSSSAPRRINQTAQALYDARVALQEARVEQGLIELELDRARG